MFKPLQDVVIILVLGLFASVFLGLFVLPASAGKGFPVTLVAPTNFMSQGPWNSLLRQIQRVPKGVPITILWQGVGGYTHIGYSITRQIADLQRSKPIRIVVTGQSISMHATALCSLGNVKRTTNGVLVFHATFNRLPDGSKTYVYSDIGRDRICINKGYLSYYDVQQMWYNGKRVVVYPNGKKVYLNDWRSK